MLVNWNSLVSAVKLVNFERVTCSFVGVTWSFDAITFRFVIPKWWILQHMYSGGNSVEEVGGGEGVKIFRIVDKFVLILNLFWQIIVWYVVFVKNRFFSFPYFSVVIKKNM